jgi:hypothetical protein
MNKDVVETSRLERRSLAFGAPIRLGADEERGEFLDRLADALFLVPPGYAGGHPWLGWLTALLAVFTAYIGVLGGALSQRQDFGGILPKQSAEPRDQGSRSL